LAAAYKKEDLEFLISTMNKSSLDFLMPMFPFLHFSNFSLLIINQTQPDNLLISEYNNVRVINAFEKGLSKSRNLAIANAKGKIGVITDDDIIFQKDPLPIILNAYNQHPGAAVIAFCAVDNNAVLFKKYPKKTKIKLNDFDIHNIMSIEMTLNTAIIKDKRVQFDHRFGLGSPFILGEEAVFLHDLKSKQQQIVFIPEVIVSHPLYTTNERVDYKKKYFAVGAVYQKLHPYRYIIWVLIKLFFDIKQNRIKLSQIVTAFSSATKGRSQLKKLSNEY
jgi:glycosyltransferase involved in cell wall biosynthesis